jgi:hypothetical protein
MLSIILIGIVVIVIIVIIILNKNVTIDTTNNIEEKLINVPILFNYKIDVPTHSRQVETNIVFKTPSDIMGNMMTFIDYAFPLINITEIEKLLKQTGINKTVRQIFDENKNLDYNEFKNKFKISILLYIYTYYFYRGTEENIRKNIRLYLLVEEAFKYIINTDNLLKQNKISNTENYNLVLNNDYMTSSIMKVYLRSNLNKNISASNAEENNQLLIQDACYYSKLCTQSLYIYDIITRNRQYINNNLPDIEKLFNLIFVKYLCNLNNTIFVSALEIEVIRLNTTDLKFIVYNNITYE